MSESARLLVHEGRRQSGAALVLAVATGAIIAASSWGETAIAGRLAAVGVATLIVALAIGSARLVGVATFPVLGSALIVSAAAEEPTWVRMIVIGCLWYVTAEVAWDAIERRDGAQRSKRFNNRRAHEISTVVVVTMAITTAGSILSSLAPDRTMFTVALAIVGLAAALALATRRLAQASTGLEAPPQAAREGLAPRDSVRRTP